MSICAAMIRRMQAFAVTSALVVGWAATPARAAPQYNIVALDVLPGGLDSLAFGLNDLGQVVGDSRKDRSTHVGQSRPVVWDYGGQPTELWSDQIIGARLAGINNAGQIVGQYGSGSGIPLPGPGVPYGRGFVWDLTGGRRDLGLTSYGNSQAVAINDSGQVAGTSEVLMEVEIEPGNVVQMFIPRAFIWDETNGIRDIGTLGGLGAFANDINASGQVVGYAQTSNSRQSAFIWSEVDGMREVPSLAGGYTRATAINDAGQVLAGDDLGPYIWDSVNGVQRIPIGGYAFNNLGQVVGGSVGGLSIWDQTNGIQYLVDLIPENTGWDLEIPFSINDAGEIVGYGLLDGNIRGFLTTPVPEPGSLPLLASASLAAAIVYVVYRALRHPGAASAGWANRNVSIA